MNIHTAAHYLSIGYRIRRASWKEGEYICECADMLLENRMMESFTWNSQIKKFEEFSYLTKDSVCLLNLSDLLAEDWEIITTGIKKDFNKYNSLEYQKEID